MKYTYEDTDKKIIISIYDLEFEIKIDIEDLKNIKELGKDTEALENEINKVLGDGAVEKINNKRIQDGYSKMDINVELAIISCIFETYANAMSKNNLDRIERSVSNVNRRINKNYRHKRYRNY